MIEFIFSYWWQLIATVILAGIAGWGYRFGGSSNGIRWVREIVVGACIIADLTLWFGWNWWGLLIMGTVWIETTYFKAKGTDAKWYNWSFVGLSYSAVPLPYMIQGNAHWKGFFIRAFIVTLFTTLWRTFQGDANKQEIGCGIIQLITLPLLLII